MLRLLWTISFILFAIPVYAGIGNVVKQKGNASVERSGEKSSLQKGSDIEFKDNVRTGNGDVGIKFVDDTNVAISPQSSLVIDAAFINWGLAPTMVVIFIGLKLFQLYF